jgi:hypothetical protein
LAWVGCGSMHAHPRSKSLGSTTSSAHARRKEAHSSTQSGATTAVQGAPSECSPCMAASQPSLAHIHRWAAQTDSVRDDSCQREWCRRPRWLRQPDTRCRLITDGVTLLAARSCSGPRLPTAVTGHRCQDWNSVTACDTWPQPVLMEPTPASACTPTGGG